MTFPTSLERDIQNRHARRQEQPGRTIQPKPPLARARRLSEDLHHQPMKLSLRKAGGSRHCLDWKRILRRTETAAEPAGRIAVPEICRCS
jgi:hypothetical protein